jgi:RNA polymerase sigma factor (sigma-70 family)
MGAEAPPTTWQVAEAVLLDGHQRARLLAYARDRFGVPAEDARDLVQDTALELLRHQTHVENPSGFVMAIFHSRCCRYADARRRGREVFTAVPEPSEIRAPEDKDSSALDRQLALRQALQEISSSCRRILAAYYVEGQTLTETAQSMALASSGVFKTLARCLKRLRKCLA